MKILLRFYLNPQSISSALLVFKMHLAIVLMVLIQFLTIPKPGQQFAGIPNNDSERTADGKNSKEYSTWAELQWQHQTLTIIRRKAMLGQALKGQDASSYTNAEGE